MDISCCPEALAIYTAAEGWACGRWQMAGPSCSAPESLLLYRECSVYPESLEGNGLPTQRPEALRPGLEKRGEPIPHKAKQVQGTQVQCLSESMHTSSTDDKIGGDKEGKRHVRLGGHPPKGHARGQASHHCTPCSKTRWLVGTWASPWARRMHLGKGWLGQACSAISFNLDCSSLAAYLVYP